MRFPRRPPQSGRIEARFGLRMMPTFPRSPHSQAHRDFTALRLIRHAFAVRERLGDREWFRLSLSILCNPGAFGHRRGSGLRCRHGLRRSLNSSALPFFPQSVSRGARISGLPGSLALRPVRLLAPFDASDQISTATEGYYFQASSRSVALPATGYHYNRS